MSRLLAIVGRTAQVGAWFGGALVLASALLVTLDVLLRKFLNVTLGGADLIAGYALAIGSAWAFVFTFVGRAHIRIDTFYLHLPRPLQLAADIVGLVLMIGFFGTVTWFALGVTEQSIALGSRSLSNLQIPVAIPQIIWVAGLLFFVLAMVLTLGRALWLMLSGRGNEARSLIGSRTLNEEIAEERAAGGVGS